MAMISTKKLLAKILSWAVKPMITDTVQTSATVGANTGATVTKSLSKDGYIPLAVIGVHIAGGSSGYAEPRQWGLNGNTVSAYIWNSTNASKTWTVTFDILWLKLGGGYTAEVKIIETGTKEVTQSGRVYIWSYRKYSDGTVECWMHGNMGSVTLNTALGTDIVSAFFGLEFPFTFDEVPCCNFNVEGNSSGYSAVQVGSTSAAHATAKNHSYYVRLSRIGSAVTLQNVMVSCHVIGKIK